MFILSIFGLLVQGTGQSLAYSIEVELITKTIQPSYGSEDYFLQLWKCSHVPMYVMSRSLIALNKALELLLCMVENQTTLNMQNKFKPVM